MFDLCAWRRCDARTLDAPSEVKANALTGWYNGKRQRRTTARGGSRGTIGRRPTCVCVRPVIRGSAQTSMSKKGREWGIPGETFPVAAPAHSTGTKSWRVWSRQGNRSKRCPGRRKTPKSSVPESVFDPNLAIIFCANVTRIKGGVCREATREVLGEHGTIAARSPPAAQRQNRPKSGVLQTMAIVTKLLRANHNTTMQPFPTVGRGVGIP